MGDEMNRQFSKVEAQMSSRHTKKFNIFIVEIQIRSPLRFYWRVGRMAIAKRTKDNNVEENVGMEELMGAYAGADYGSQHSLKNRTTISSYGPVIGPSNGRNQ